MLILICVLVALPAGWFAGVLVDRVPDKEPLFSPLAGVRLRGRYLTMYLMMMASFAAAAWQLEDVPRGQLATVLVLFAALVPLSVIDIQLFRLPDRIVVPTIVICLVMVVVVSVLNETPEAIRFALAGGAFYFGFLFLTHLIYPKGMGFGDVKLAVVMGLVIGWFGDTYAKSIALVLWGMVIGFVLGSFVGIILLISRKRSKAIPFGPFLAVGCAAAILFNTGLVNG